MEFKDKLNFLFRLTQTTGADLSQETGIIRSTISCWKSGRRGFPRSLDTARALSGFFAKRMDCEYCRGALAEFSDYEVVISAEKHLLAEHMLQDWLSNGTAREPHLLPRGMVAAKHEPPAPGGPAPSGVLRGSGEFYGREGRVEAIRSLLMHILSVEHPKTLYVWIEDDAAWKNLSRDSVDLFLLAMQTVVERGAEIVQLLPPPGTAHYYDMLQYWMPVYLTGKVRVFHYPWMRDSVMRGFFIALDDEIAMMSYGILGNRKTVSGKFSTEKGFVEYVRTMFDVFIERCVPGMTLLRGVEVREALRRIYLHDDDVMTVHSHIPPYFPMGSHAQSITMMIPFASPADIAAGRVTIPDAELPAAEWPKHTPESYAELMRSLLVWMDDPNHEAIPLVYGTQGTHSIIVRPGKQALVIFDNSGVLAADMSVPAIVQFFEELVRRKIGEGRSGNAEKERLRRRIVDTISRLRRMDG